MTRIVITSDNSTYSSEDGAKNLRDLRELQTMLRGMMQQLEYKYHSATNPLPTNADIVLLARNISALTAVTGANDLSRHDLNGATLKGDFTGVKLHRGYIANANMEEADTTDAEVVIMTRSALTVKFNDQKPPVFVIHKGGKYQPLNVIVDPETHYLAAPEGDEETKKILVDIAYNAFRRGIVQTHTNKRLDVPADSPVRKYFEMVPTAYVSKTIPDKNVLAITAPVQQALDSLKDTKWHDRQAFIRFLEKDAMDPSKEASREQQLHYAKLAYNRGVELDHPAYREVAELAKKAANDAAPVAETAVPAVSNG